MVTRASHGCPSRGLFPVPMATAAPPTILRVARFRRKTLGPDGGGTTLTRKDRLTMSIVRRPQSLPALTAVCSILFTGCVLGPKYRTPSVATPAAATYKESPTNFQDVDGWKVASPSDGLLRGHWWEIFNDPDLNVLEDQVDINNQNIRRSFEAFMEARALVAQAHAQYWPTVTVGASAVRAGSSGALVRTVPSGQQNAATTVGTTALTGNLFFLPVEVAWLPDFFGKVRMKFANTSTTFGVCRPRERTPDRAGEPRAVLL